MKKYLLTLIISLVSISTFAQEKNTWQETKSFLGSCKYEIVVGYNTTVVSAPFDHAKIGYNLGVTARKDIKTFKDGKIAVNGIVGLILTKRGGKMDDDFMTLGDDTRNWSFSALSVPVHVGGEYKFKKVSVFADLGPNMLFKTGGGEMENLSAKTFGVGAGFNLGMRFKKFAISFGVDEDITKMGTFKPSQDQQRDLNLDKDKYNLKTGEFHFDLRWTL